MGYGGYKVQQFIPQAGMINSKSQVTNNCILWCFCTASRCDWMRSSAHFHPVVFSPCDAVCQFGGLNIWHLRLSGSVIQLCRTIVAFFAKDLTRSGSRYHRPCVCSVTLMSMRTWLCLRERSLVDHHCKK